MTMSSTAPISTASIAVGQQAGLGTLSYLGGNAWLLNMGTLQQGEPRDTATLSFTDVGTAPLAASLTHSGDGFGFGGAASLSLPPGGSYRGYAIHADTSQLGVHVGFIEIAPTTASAAPQFIVVEDTVVGGGIA